MYPDAMAFTGVPGHVLVEFVVDTLGSVEHDTFGVVSSTNPQLTAGGRTPARGNITRASRIGGSA